MTKYTTTPEFVGVNPLRIALAFTLFLSTIIGGGWTLIEYFTGKNSSNHLEQSPQTKLKQAKIKKQLTKIWDKTHRSPKSDTDHEFFYAQIGNTAPIQDEDDADQGDSSSDLNLLTTQIPLNSEPEINASPELFQRAATPLSQHYTLELAAFHDRHAAEQLIQELHQKGTSAFYTPLAQGDQVIYRVRQGVYPSHKDAERASLALAREKKLQAKIVLLQ